jgi:hypothetical protein
VHSTLRAYRQKAPVPFFTFLASCQQTAPPILYMPVTHKTRHACDNTTDAQDLHFSKGKGGSTRGARIANGRKTENRTPVRVV